MSKQKRLSSKSSLLLISLVSVLSTSQFANADQQGQAQVTMLGAQIPSRTNNIEAGAFVHSQQRAYDVMVGPKIIGSATNIAAGEYINPQQMASNLMAGAIHAVSLQAVTYPMK